MNFSDKLRKLRETKNITREQLSKDTGISEGSISSYELGRRKPKIETVTLIAKYFNVPIDYLKSDNSIDLDVDCQQAVREVSSTVLNDFENFCTVVDETTLDRIHAIITALIEIYKSDNLHIDDKTKIFAALTQSVGFTALFINNMSVSEKSFSKIYLDSLNEIINTNNQKHTNKQDDTMLEIAENPIINTECEVDEQKQKLIDNYRKLNISAQRTLVDYSDFMISKSENLKESTNTDKMIS